MLSSAFEQTADHVMIADREGIILYVNPAFERTTGYKKEELLGRTPRLLKSGRYDDEFYKNLWKTILEGKTFQQTMVNRKKNGEFYYADQTITPIQDAAGRITHFISIWKDITERTHAREEVDRLHEHLVFEKQKLEKILNFGEKVTTINNLNKLIDFIIEQASSILESERCSLMLLDEEKNELCIRGAIGLETDIIKKSKLSVGEGIAGIVAQEGKPVLVEIIDTDKRFHRESLPTYKTKSFLSVPIKLDHKLIGVVNVTDKKSKDSNAYSEIDLKILLAIVRQAAVAIENAQLSKELKYLTITDTLTSLYNYRYLMESLAYEIRRHKRFNRPLCLLIMDVDDFKEYNDAYGHLEGDQALRHIGAVLKAGLREVDIVCRYAGDEFVVILPETGVEKAKNIAEKILKMMAKLKCKRPVTLSMGIAKCVKGMGHHDFVLKADAALHKAKKDGKNKIYSQGK